MKHDLQYHTPLLVRLIAFEGEEPPLSTYDMYKRDDIYIESLEDELYIPFLRFSHLGDVKEVPPNKPERP